MRVRARSTVRVALRHAALVASLLAAGCRSDVTTPGIPGEPPYLRGVITEVGASWGYRLEGTPGPQFQESKAYFGVRGATILRRSGERADVSALVVGEEVSIWITGLVRESYPVQVDAVVVVVESG
ncbi:MAG: hypothetical protein IPF98_03050 [Gemmatimonadetes bacterium]|nr:hypothetical protein [Gemmatimonadota bacterium]